MSLREELERRLKGRVVLVGVGNPMWGDDGAGPALIHRLEGKIPVLLVDGGEVPEHYWGTIVAYQPQAILVVDAIDWGGNPGSVALLDKVQKTGPPLSTHRIPLNLFLDLLRIGTGGDVFVLGIQPKVVVLNGAMSPEVQQTLELMEDLFTDILVRGVRC